VSTWETEVTEFSTTAIDPALFEIPSGFKLVERIRQEPVPPLVIPSRTACNRRRASSCGHPSSARPERLLATERPDVRDTSIRRDHIVIVGEHVPQTQAGQLGQFLTRSHGLG